MGDLEEAVDRLLADGLHATAERRSEIARLAVEQVHAVAAAPNPGEQALLEALRAPAPGADHPTDA